ncbi:MAG: hypothetical protein A2W82_07430 [Sulfurimonas sp. RIFCSPLOWO2_12_36_12]|uniref:hypothetical protein n=1 Tax=Sulfurimonas sp. RIFCSPLOWO2_12_36_12 TaxID=1802253 RepID=UPI0008CC0015|nr:hypothetical protein [Sulfurimonas sp. RIFCSPLOWO2_12_36_12]OHE00309.1 MAG: hypothetical protein A3J26_03735 [Sulfurimonas sp. RIFCSPLOWO2_02_FULL_36_28]OHE02942.1 MAG: hypothetical protein A2W82_07430 [Sulfurimonas sp. RIFCSPLOWO2_12_36_12]
MSLRIIVLALYFFLVINGVADDNATKQTYREYIDEKQKKFSKKVVNLFDSVDKGISGWIDDSDDNISCDEMQARLDDEFLRNQNSIDQFFKSDKYIDETEASYLRIRLGSVFQSKESTEFNYKIRAQIPLSRTKRSFQLFIDDVEENYFDAATPTETAEKSTEVGVKYTPEVRYDIKSKYSIGISSLVAYAKARYSKDFIFEKWLIQPTQQFKYSLESDWSEETNIYFDRTLKENSIFRTTLHRKTQAHMDGFNYAAAFSYYLTLSKRKGFSVSQQFWGNTKYVCLEHPEQYNGISDYSTIASWRQNIFRKWITYEVQPGVSFHRQYDYDPNYMLRFYVDFYFGNID